jgi:hypothetical protein
MPSPWLVLLCGLMAKVKLEVKLAEKLWPCLGLDIESTVVFFELF